MYIHIYIIPGTILEPQSISNILTTGYKGRRTHIKHISNIVSIFDIYISMLGLLRSAPFQLPILGRR